MMKVKCTSGAYRHIQEGESFLIDLSDPIFRMECCDCSLVHDFKFKLTADEKGKVLLEVTPSRNNRATAQLRRHKK